MFVGWRVVICSNQVLTGQGVKLSIEVMDLKQLYQQVMELFSQFNPAKDIHLMQTLSNTYLTETQFAQIVGRMRLYQALGVFLPLITTNCAVLGVAISVIQKDYSLQQTQRISPLP